MAQDIESAQSALEAGFAKIGGKKVRGATPKPAESVKPEPEKFAEVGGQFVGKSPEHADAGQPTAPMASSLPENSPFFDHAARVLNTKAQHLDLGSKGDLWDAFTQSHSPQELATALMHPSFDHVGNDIKHELYLAKSSTMPAQSHTSKVVDVMNRMAGMDKHSLEVAEKHPAVLRALISGKD